ncbi:hypothetical protein [Vibrio nigripulchritudo]|uniref:hypothetical protein n=1 Tax=Vibrio nigripulchritudo TaxID=28173 RepID=UPI002491C529|nr:hypothetical protein [Vibrio nigripulchritudo]BDU36783.1 hypothetical protein TUMSATVNIG2_12520 [Vibrio nigripulchritudo]BDU42493.1 hypothetical protein TUMSATVNIG3_12910 [Vibrio nigripulchritudo]
MIKISHLMASVALLSAVSAHASDYTLSLLDFNSTIDNGDIVFAPFKNTTRGTGYVWFRDYDYEYRQPVPGEYRNKTLTVSFTPRSILTGEFTAFAQEHNIRPNRKTIVPDDAVLCQPTQALTDVLSTFEYSSVSTRPPGYPKLCSLVIRYNTSAEKEAKLLELIDTKQLMHAQFSLSDPANQPAPGVYIEVPTIVSQLVEQKVLELDLPPLADPVEPSIPHVDIGFYGQAQGIIFYSAHADETLFGFEAGLPIEQSQLFQRWTQFIDLFQSVEGQPGYWVIPDALATTPIVISEPIPSTPFIEVMY